MVKDYNDRIESMKATLSKTQDELLETYLNRIRELHTDESARVFIQNGLENIIHKVEKMELTEDSTFNTLTAIKLRLDAGYSTQTNLANALSLTQKQISFYELGKIKNPLSGSDARKYFLWLKEQGYNPFDL